MGAALQTTTKNSPAEDEPQKEQRRTTITKNHFDRKKKKKKTLTEPRENAMLLELRNQANQNWGRTKRNATQLERHATPRKLRVQRKHNVGTWPPHAPKQHTAGQESAPMLTNNGKCYKRKHSHAQRYGRPMRYQRMPKTPGTIAPSR